jgi:hypothetical protein
LLFFAEQFAARSIDEMNPTAGLAHHGFVGASGSSGAGSSASPVLHVHTGPGTSEDEIAHGAGSLTPARFSALIRVNIIARDVCKRARIKSEGVPLPNTR